MLKFIGKTLCRFNIHDYQDVPVEKYVHARIDGNKVIIGKGSLFREGGIIPHVQKCSRCGAQLIDGIRNDMLELGEE
jgi:hypothetical protein